MVPKGAAGSISSKENRAARGGGAETAEEQRAEAARQLADVARQRRLDEKTLPEHLQYSQIKGLRIEAAQKLERIRPRTLGQASRISGVNPADISVLMIYLGIH